MKVMSLSVMGFFVNSYIIINHQITNLNKDLIKSGMRFSNNGPNFSVLVTQRSRKDRS